MVICLRTFIPNILTRISYRIVLLIMRLLSPLFVLSIMIMMSLSPLVMDSELDNGDSVSAIGPKSLIDFEITSIEVGNQTRDAKEWTQPDGSILEYVMRDETIQINVTYTQAGSSGQPASAEGYLQIWHPIGFIIAEYNVSMLLSGFQSMKASFVWTPSSAHSALDENGYLVGGIILRGIVDGGLADDTESNNELDRYVPVAMWNDPMENGFCGDVDGDNTIDCTNQLQSNVPTWVGAGYDASGQLSSDPDSFGHWRMENSSSVDGENHWRVSRPGASYASNRHDKLWWGWFTPFDNCNEPGHGLGLGTLDSAVSSNYGNNFCKIRLKGFDFLTIQLVTNAWGQMAAGDQIRLEADSGGLGEFYNFTSQQLSTTGDWSQLVWNMTEIHESAEYTLAFRFDSNSSYSSPGIQLDSFLLFAVEKVPQYTLDFDCNDPLPNSYLVVPSDPNPPSLYCKITNNGYIDITLRLYTEVTNISWMYNFPLRIDSNNPVDHDNYVVSKIIPALGSMDTWFNLTIPDASGVQDLFWDVWVNDGVTNLSKEYVRLPVTVMPAYSCKLRQATLQNPAATLEPGASGVIPLTLKNTGNQIATWNFGATFPNIDWVDNAEIKWMYNGSEVSNFELGLTDEINIDAIITVPLQVSPGTYLVTLLASGMSPAQYLAEWQVNIVVPIYSDLVIEPEISNLVAPADDSLRLIEIRLVNNGNSPESFDLTIQADWKLGIEMNTEQTFEIDPFGGDSTVTMLLPMPYGIINETYSIIFTATSKTNTQYQKSSQILLTVPQTNLVDVEDLDMLAEVFRGGDDPRTVNWRIWNRGNVPDSFEISFDHFADVSASVVGLNGGQTPFILPGDSYNLTVRYSFGANTNGDRTISLTAISVLSQNIGSPVSGTGDAAFQVGAQGWITLHPPSPLDIREKGNDIEVVFTVTNEHPTDAQLLRADIERDSDIFFNIIDARVDDGDQNFVLEAQASRQITVYLTVTEGNLKNLNSTVANFQLFLEVDGDIDKVSKSASINMYQLDPEPEGPDAGKYAGIFGNLLFILIGLILLVVVLIATMRVMRSASSPLEEISSFDDYEYTQSSGLNLDPLPGAPELPSADKVANSMYGGSKEIFEQPPPQFSPPHQEEVVEEVVLEETVQEVELPSGVPPVPESGLPEGWTMDQWIHYGQAWIEQQNRD